MGATWLAAVLPEAAGGDAFQGLKPARSVWLHTLRALEASSGAHRTAQRATCDAPVRAGSAREAWTHAILHDALEDIASDKMGMRLGPVHVHSTCATPAHGNMTWVLWNVTACFYIPGQPRGRCAQLQVAANVSAANPDRWSWTIMRARDVGVIPEAAILTVPGPDFGRV